MIPMDTVREISKVRVNQYFAPEAMRVEPETIAKGELLRVLRNDFPGVRLDSVDTHASEREEIGSPLEDEETTPRKIIRISTRWWPREESRVRLEFSGEKRSVIVKGKAPDEPIVVEVYPRVEALRDPDPMAHLDPEEKMVLTAIGWDPASREWVYGP